MFCVVRGHGDHDCTIITGFKGSCLSATRKMILDLNLGSSWDPRCTQSAMYKQFTADIWRQNCKLDNMRRPLQMPVRYQSSVGVPLTADQKAVWFQRQNVGILGETCAEINSLSTIANAANNPGRSFEFRLISQRLETLKIPLGTRDPCRIRTSDDPYPFPMLIKK